MGSHPDRVPAALGNETPGRELVSRESESFERRILRGRVVDSLERPLADVAIRMDTLSEEAEVAAMTGSDGRFRLELARRPGSELEVLLFASAEGYESGTHRARAPLGTDTPTDPRNSTLAGEDEMRIVLLALPAVEGRIVLPDGSPVGHRGRVWIDCRVLATGDVHTHITDTFVCLDGPMHYGQPQTASALARRKKGVEHLWHVFERDAWTGVGDAEAEWVIDRGPARPNPAPIVPNLDCDLPLGPRKLQCVE